MVIQLDLLSVVIWNSRTTSLSVEDCCVSPSLNKVDLFIYLFINYIFIYLFIYLGEVPYEVMGGEHIALTWVGRLS